MNLEDLKKFNSARDLTIKYEQIALDAYAVICDWYHYAILELIKVEAFRPDISYVARTLGISQTEAHIAVERLRRMAFWKFETAGGLTNHRMAT